MQVNVQLHIYLAFAHAYTDLNKYVNSFLIPFAYDLSFVVVELLFYVMYANEILFKLSFWSSRP